MMSREGMQPGHSKNFRDLQETPQNCLMHLYSWGSPSPMNLKVLPPFPCLVHGWMFLILCGESIQDLSVELPARTEAAAPDFGSIVNKTRH